MKLRLMLVTMLAALTVPAFAQTQTKSASAAPATPTPCSGPEHRALDFWVGEWVAEWEQNGAKGSGTNRITRDELGRCVITEHFRVDDGSFNGLSVSTYRPGIKQWRQTWVDDQGGYFDLVGGPVSGGDYAFYFENKRPFDAAPFWRMIFQDVKPDSFTWRWQGRAKADDPWKDNWVIHYHRKAGKAASSAGR